MKRPKRPFHTKLKTVYFLITNGCFCFLFFVFFLKNCLPTSRTHWQNTNHNFNDISFVNGHFLLPHFRIYWTLKSRRRVQIQRLTFMWNIMVYLLSMEFIIPYQVGNISGVHQYVSFFDIHRLFAKIHQLNDRLIKTDSPPQIHGSVSWSKDYFQDINVAKSQLKYWCSSEVLLF